MGAEGTAGPRWSPDGETIAFNSNPDGQQDIYLVSAAGGKPRRLTSHQGNELQPSFSHDGLRFFDFATGKSTTVADRLGDVRLSLTASADGRTILYTKLDSIIDDLMMVENFR